MPTLSNEPVNNQWLVDILTKYGNYTTVKKDWDKFDGAEQFEIVGGNKRLLDEAVAAILSKLESIEQEARIDELENFTYSGASKWEIDERIAELKRKG
jgi:hypothetical protein